MTFPRVLVLLAVHNGEPWLDQHLDTLAAQQQVDLQVVMADDASTDASAACCRRRAAADPRFLCIAPSTPGGSASRNFFRLLLEANLHDAEYVAFCDQDDRWHPDRLQAGVEQLRATGAALYSSATRAFWPDGHTRVLGQVDRLTAADFLFEGAGQGCSFLMTRFLALQMCTLLRRHGRVFGQVHYHDWAVYAVARALRLGWTFDAQPRLEYRQHGGNDTGARASLAGVGKRLALIRSGWYARQVADVVRVVECAVPGHPVLVQWNSAQRGGRLRRALFLARHGRRRRSDRLVSVLAALAGWL